MCLIFIDKGRQQSSTAPPCFLGHCPGGNPWLWGRTSWWSLKRPPLGIVARKNANHSGDIVTSTLEMLPLFPGKNNSGGLFQPWPLLKAGIVYQGSMFLGRDKEMEKAAGKQCGNSKLTNEELCLNWQMNKGRNKEGGREQEVSHIQENPMLNWKCIDVPTTTITLTRHLSL